MNGSNEGHVLEMDPVRQVPEVPQAEPHSAIQLSTLLTRGSCHASAMEI